MALVRSIQIRPRNICVCKQVPYNVVENAIKKGAHSFESIQKMTGAGTGCGTCRGRIEEEIEKHS